MKKVLFIIAFILLSSKANAETILVCNSCDSQIQALNFASEQLSHRGKFNGLISVGNVQEGKNYAFNVFYTGGGEDRFGNEIPITLEVQQAPVPYSTIQLFQSIGQTKLYLDAMHQ